MAYITREDGEHFVIPSYRDVLTSRQPSVLKKEIVLLSQNYGEYITLQKKGSNQYELAFSTETGYLLGESIWHFFKRPQDMVYCEVIPNTTDAIVVIVKSGSVYLDGQFPIDTIPEELVVFLTQQNNFEIYLYGDVPISKEPEEGKFSFEPNSIKSFTRLDEPIFTKLPLIKSYHLELVDQVLQAQGIGVFPLQKALILILALIGLWMGYSWLTREGEVQEQVVSFVTNPYQAYFQKLMTPDPTLEVEHVSHLLTKLLTAPNWSPQKIKYENGLLTATMLSYGGTVETLFDWAKINNATVDITPKGMNVNFSATLPGRSQPKQIFPLNQVMAKIIDKLETVNPGNTLKLSSISKTNEFSSVTITISINGVTPEILQLIGEQFKNSPIVIKNMAFDFNGNAYSGSIIIETLGS